MLCTYALLSHHTIHFSIYFCALALLLCLALNSLQHDFLPTSYHALHFSITSYHALHFSITFVPCFALCGQIITGEIIKYLKYAYMSDVVSDWLGRQVFTSITICSIMSIEAHIIPSDSIGASVKWKSRCSILKISEKNLHFYDYPTSSDSCGIISISALSRASSMIGLQRVE